MRYGVPTTTIPSDPRSIYMRNLYHEFFWGPFSDEREVAMAIVRLDTADPHWDHDPFCMVYGANPLPRDFVGGFPDVSQEFRNEVMRLSRDIAIVTMRIKSGEVERLVTRHLLEQSKPGEAFATTIENMLELIGIKSAVVTKVEYEKS